MNKKVLIVDDEKNIRMTLRHCLADEGYQLEIAVNGEEALQKMSETTFDLALLDIKMPGLTGMQVLERVRQSENKINVIMMTAYGTVERAVEAMKLGAIDFISKPFTPDEIRSIVRDVLNRNNLDEASVDTLKELIEYSKKCILNKDYVKAEEFLKKAIGKEVQAPEAYNLLGVLCEYRKDINTAQKYYRIALELDPTYKAAQMNLERTAQYMYTQRGIALGDEENEGQN